LEKLAENDLTYFYLRHVVIVVTAVATISLPPVLMGKQIDCHSKKKHISDDHNMAEVEIGKIVFC
jgi:uncharacterized ubiquitin-like protein YukD